MLFKFKSHLLNQNPILFFKNYFFNIYFSHLALHSLIHMTLKWHHKNMSNKITIVIEFWWLPNVLFGSFDCDYTLHLLLPFGVVWEKRSFDSTLIEKKFMKFLQYYLVCSMCTMCIFFHDFFSIINCSITLSIPIYKCWTSCILCFVIQKLVRFLLVHIAVLGNAS